MNQEITTPKLCLTNNKNLCLPKILMQIISFHWLKHHDFYIRFNIKRHDVIFLIRWFSSQSTSWSICQLCSFLSATIPSFKWFFIVQDSEIIKRTWTFMFLLPLCFLYDSQRKSLLIKLLEILFILRLPVNFIHIHILLNFQATKNNDKLDWTF